MEWFRALARANVSATARRVGLVVGSHSPLTLGASWPVRKTLARESGLTPQSVSAGLAELEAAGLIRVTSGRGEALEYDTTMPGDPRPRLAWRVGIHPRAASATKFPKRAPVATDATTPVNSVPTTPVSTVTTGVVNTVPTQKDQGLTIGGSGEDSTDATAPWFTGDNEPPTDRDERAPDDVIASLDEFATVDAPLSAETPQVPPPPLSPVTEDAPAAPRKRPARARKVATEGKDGAPDPAQGVMALWDAAWARAFRKPYQKCDETCGNVGKSRCKSHFPGYAWGRGDVFQVRKAVDAGGPWTPERIVRLFPLYHRSLDGTTIPRTITNFLRAASTLEAQNPPPVQRPVHVNPPRPVLVTESFPMEPRPVRQVVIDTSTPEQRARAFRLKLAEIAAADAAEAARAAGGAA